jgi:hypothetical protein
VEQVYLILDDFPEHEVLEHKIKNLLHLDIHNVIAFLQQVLVLVHKHFLERISLIKLISLLFTLEEYDAEGNVEEYGQDLSVEYYDLHKVVLVHFLQNYMDFLPMLLLLFKKHLVEIIGLASIYEVTTLMMQFREVSVL